MEELTKQQIVLVALLVSFVTSIATGIVTVALMDQAPPGVTQTINRVVERTVEKVTPPLSQQAAAVVTKETIVVKEDDLIVKAVEKNIKSLVSVFKVEGAGEGAGRAFIANGLVVSKDGLIASDARAAAAVVDESGNPIAATLEVVLPDGKILPASVAGSVRAGLVLLRPTPANGAKLPAFVPATLGDSAALKLGQSVATLGGEEASVATSIVASLVPPFGTLATDDAAKLVKLIKTTVSAQVVLGSILFTLSGDVVGIRASSLGDDDTLFLPADLISKILLKNP